MPGPGDTGLAAAGGPRCARLRHPRHRCRGGCPPSGPAQVSGPRRGLLRWHQMLLPHRGFVRSRFLVALPLAFGLRRGGSSDTTPAQPLPAPPATTGPAVAPTQLLHSGGKSPFSPSARLSRVQGGGPPCPSFRGAGAGNGIPKAAVPAAPSCPGISLPALPPLPQPPPPCTRRPHAARPALTPVWGRAGSRGVQWDIPAGLVAQPRALGALRWARALDG